MILAGTCAMEDMGLKTIGFAGGRRDIWEPERDVYWGKETQWLGDKRYEGKRDLEKPLAAVQMGLIYVNAEGPNGEPNALAAGKDIRDTFARMGMNDEETVALIAGGHTFGKSHGAGSPTFVGGEPEAAPMEQMGLGWKSGYKSGKGADTIGNGIEGAWTPNPTKWDNGYFEMLFKYDWVLVKSPAGSWEWIPSDPEARKLVPDAHIPGKTNAPMMMTTDLALRMDPIYGPISRDYYEHPDKFEKAFAKAWFKLTHRDLGPVTRYLGDEVPKETFLWQDPIPAVDYKLADAKDIEELKKEIASTGLSVSELVATAWASAASFRGSDRRGGPNGARIRFEPETDWEVNKPEQLKKVLKIYEKIQKRFNAKAGDGKKISLADLIVLGGNVGIEKAAKAGGCEMAVPFTPWRNDALESRTDKAGLDVLEPKADAFRNFRKAELAEMPAEAMMVDKAQLLTLTIPEMTVLIGGLRVLDINSDGSKNGVLTDRPQVLSNDFFVNILDFDTTWSPVEGRNDLYEGKCRESGKLRFTGTRADLVFGSNAELRAVAEVYASDDGREKFYRDFAAAWHKVMNLDKF